MATTQKSIFERLEDSGVLNESNSLYTTHADREVARASNRYVQGNFQTYTYRFSSGRDLKAENVSYNWHKAWLAKYATASKCLLTELDSKVVLELPNKLKDIWEAIEKSKYLLKLKSNWDGEGALKIDSETWLRAINFIGSYAKYAMEEKDVILATPTITPLFDGSIDILLENKEFVFIANIPSKSNELAAFYHDNHKGVKRKGTFTQSEFDEDVMGYLLKMKS